MVKQSGEDLAKAAEASHCRRSVSVEMNASELRSLPRVEFQAQRGTASGRATKRTSFGTIGMS
jgi:hypothetical protein